MRIRWSKFSLQGEEETASRLGLFILREIMSGAAGLRIKDTRRGAVASFCMYINFWAEPTHVDLRLPDGKFLLEVPIDFVRTLD